MQLLEADPELGESLDAEELRQAQAHVTVASVTLEPGPWSVERLVEVNGVRGEVLGFLVLDGAVTINLSIADRGCTRLVGPSELVLLGNWESDSIPLSWGWSALEPSTLAVLDERVLVLARHWPGLMSAILRRGAQQMRHALLQQAISQLPRVEDRLLALIWSIAERRGVVRSDGVFVSLAMTHDTLSQMIGARRPTVSLGLRNLSVRGLLTALPSGWLLAPESLEELCPTARAQLGGVGRRLRDDPGLETAARSVRA